MQEVTDDTWDELVTEPTIVKFYANWCGPCRMLAPTVERVAEETPDINWVAANVDTARKAAQKYNIMSIPRLLYFHDGVVEELSGRTQRQIKAELTG